MSLTILLGDYGTGKTRVAKYLSRQNGGVYLDVDALSKTGVFVDNLSATIKPGINYYLDGMNGNFQGGPHLSQLLGPQIKYIVCMEAPAEVRKRQAKKAWHVVTPLPRTEADIVYVTHLAASLALTYDPDTVFVDTTTGPISFWNKDNWLTRWMEINVYSELKDKHAYQDVELSDRTIRGLSKSYKTWERLNALLDFLGKSVCDYGCNNGYFCFKTEEAGASIIIGVDESRSVIETAARIAMTKNSRVQLVTADLKAYNPPDVDILLALNVLHHLDYDNRTLKAIFNHAGTVALELPVKDLDIVDAFARAYFFGKPTIASSHREDRCIVIYSKARPVVLLSKYAYHPRREALKKLWFHNILGVASRIKGFMAGKLWR